VIGVVMSDLAGMGAVVEGRQQLRMFRNAFGNSA